MEALESLADRLEFDDEGVFTHTSAEQISCEQACWRSLCAGASADPHDISDRAPLLRDQHAAFLLSSLHSLPQSYVSLDASRPWIAYWCLVRHDPQRRSAARSHVLLSLLPLCTAACTGPSRRAPNGNVSRDR